jgi:hypothetical protein
VTKLAGLIASTQELDLQPRLQRAELGAERRLADVADLGGAAA